MLQIENVLQIDKEVEISLSGQNLDSLQQNTNVQLFNKVRKGLILPFHHAQQVFSGYMMRRQRTKKTSPNKDQNPLAALSLLFLDEWNHSSPPKLLSMCSVLNWCQ